MSTPHWVDTNAWPYEPRWCETSDGRLHYIDEGEGAPVLFVHGTPTWSFEWRYAIEALKATNRVIAVDHLGFGRSDRPTGADYTPEAHARRFKEFISALALDHSGQPPLTVVVHDFGGPIALDWILDCASSHPECIARVVVVNSWCWSLERDPVMWRRAKVAGTGLVRWLYRQLNASPRFLLPGAYGDRKRLPRGVHANYQAVFDTAEVRERVLFALAQSLTASSPYFEGLWNRRAALNRTPLHILWGLADSAFPPHMLEVWKQGFPHVTIERFEGVGHWPHEEAPEMFVPALVALLHRDSGQDSPPSGAP
ncbi:MAG: alpha/beta fold hydrolase [Gemmatimonadaceae bacterium]|nr:alpha/beta fold hydrolase [Gemmatimonadaceae bacterium]